MAVANRGERVELIRESRNRILDGIVARTNGWDECDYFRSSSIMLDIVADATWKTTGDGDAVVSIWARQRRRYMASGERCQAELVALKKEKEILTLEVYKQTKKSFTVRERDLTKEDIAIRKECKEKIPMVAERLLVLARLLGLYSNWDVGERGRKIEGGRLYERFKALSPEELKRFESDIGMEDKDE